jgi:uncharacterized protein (DUF4415 family)
MLRSGKGQSRVSAPKSCGDHKAVVTMWLGADLLDWFRREQGYQTRINAILRTYMKESP